MMRPDPRSGIRAYTLNEIDGMDIFYYIKLLGQQKKAREQEQLAKVDSYGYC